MTSSPNLAMTPRAFLAYLHAHRERVTPTGRLVAAVGDDVTYFGLADFEQALEEVLGQARHSPDLDEAVPH